MITSMHYGATAETFRLAEFLRKNMTPAEKQLWEFLSKSYFGYRFRCQHPTERYVVDFYCHPVQLVVEIDGDVHLEDFASLNNLQREMRLLSFGLNIVRFTNEQVMWDIDGVLMEIKSVLYALTLIHPSRRVKSPLGDLGAKNDCIA